MKTLVGMKEKLLLLILLIFTKFHCQNFALSNEKFVDTYWTGYQSTYLATNNSKVPFFLPTVCPLWFKILTQTIGNGWQAKFNQQFSIIVCPSIYSFSEFSRAHRHLFNTKFLFSFWGDIKCAEWKNKKVLNATFTS